MDLERARAFVREHHRGVLSTVRADGRPQMSAVSVALDDDGRAAISTRETAYKVGHIRKDPRVSLFVMSDDFWSWIQVDGTATVVSL
ncbi:MAG TPA: TIGR03618 family F420-dependent PPOX class oxidoreductase, partial [Acidimicrobiales bacterium]|nr:TIGR03618 family F420-dependent PPOX class oxidoreductase [Acidimicrobiales bacterium]